MEQAIETVEIKEIDKFEFESKEYILMQPSAAIVREANKRRNRKFVECLKDGIYTKNKMQRQILDENPDFFIEFNTARSEVLQNIEETEALLNDIEDPDQLEALSHILVIYRAELVEQEQMLRGIFESTADEMADEERYAYLVFAMLRDSEGNAISNDFNDFLENVSYEFFDHCKYKLLCWEHKLDTNWEEALPEAKALIRASSIRKEAKKKEESKEKKPKTTRKRSPKKSSTTKKAATAKRKTTTKKKVVKKSTTSSED